MTLFVPLITDEDDVLGAALKYADAGWYCIPVRANDRKNPGSRIGKGWHHQSSRDPQQIVAWFAGSDDVLALHVGRSGAVVFDVDDPDRLPEVLATYLLGPLCPPHQSSQPDQPGRGHYVLRQAPGRLIGNSTGKLGKGWGEVRGKNGVIIVAPSRHARAADGACYEWLGTGDVPMLPDELAELLPDAGEATDAATDEEVRRFIAAHTTARTPGKLQGPLTKFAELLKDGKARHDSLVIVACWAMRDAVAGWYTAEAAVDQLRAVFIAAMATRRKATDRVLEPATATAEADGVFAWAIAQASQPSPENDRPNQQDGRGGAEPSTAARSMLQLPILPADFWAARPRLANIRQAAHSRLVAADLVLHVVFARLAAMRSHELWFDTGRGRSSLNYFAAPVGPTGVGKTTGVAAADGELLPVPLYLKMPKEGCLADAYYDGMPSGSGEGIAEAYIGEISAQVDEDADGSAKTKKVRGQVRHNVFIYADEGEQLLRIGERAGATALTTIRSAWVGETIGQHNGRAETTRVVKRGMYSLGMIVGFQPAKALPLLGETAGGTAQRFAWLSAVDSTIPDEPVEHPGPLSDVLTDAPFANSARTGRMSFPADVVAQLRRDHIAKVRGELLVDEADSHEPLMRAKMAALLALLDDRTDVDTEDWQLAQVLWRTSRAVRDAVAEYGREQAQREQAERDSARVTLAERTAAVVDVAPVRVQRIAHRLAVKVHEAKGMTRGAARRDVLAKSERHLYEAAVTVAETRGWLTADGSGALLPGPENPS